ncbi:MAG: DUF6485 family protein [Candidatus Omnitrophota bacterium]
MKNCLNQKQNLTYCSCSYPSCSRKGICCECVEYHRNKGEIPGCFFLPEIEKTYDRTIGNFVKTHR